MQMLGQGTPMRVVGWQEGRGGVSETGPGFRLTVCKNRFFFKNQILVKLVCQLVVLYKSLHCPTLQGSRRSHFRRISQLNAFPFWWGAWMQPKEDFHFHRGCTIAQLSMCPVVFEHNFGSWDPRRHSNLREAIQCAAYSSGSAFNCEMLPLLGKLPITEHHFWGFRLKGVQLYVIQHWSTCGGLSSSSPESMSYSTSNTSRVVSISDPLLASSSFSSSALIVS